MPPLKSQKKIKKKKDFLSLVSFFQSIWKGVKGVFSTIWKGFLDFVVIFWKVLKDISQAVFVVLKEVFSFMFKIIKMLFDLIKTIIFGISAFIASVALFIISIGLLIFLVSLSVGAKESPEFQNAREIWFKTKAIAIEKILIEEFKETQENLSEDEQFNGNIPSLFSPKTNDDLRLKRFIEYLVEQEFKRDKKGDL